MSGPSNADGEKLAPVRKALNLHRLRGALGAGLQRVARAHVVLLALVWFGAALSTTLWVWGLDPIVFLGDEAVNRMAAQLIRDTGRPIIDLPVDDPENLLHMHEWTTFGRQAAPIYPPVLFYLYGFLLKLGVVGQFLINALPASGVAAFFYGTARLLPPARRWLAFSAPLLGMPATYWILRPWQNVALMLTGVCWGFCWWAIWRERQTTRYLAAALFSVGMGAAVRPDFAAHLLTIAMFVSLAVAPRSYRKIIGLVIASGVVAVAANLLLNRAISGTSFRPLYETVLDRDHDTASAGPFSLLLRLWFPIGIPNAGETLELIHKYWIEMNQLKWLLAAQLAIIPLFFGLGWSARVFYALALLGMLGVLVSHSHQELFGVGVPHAHVHHSIPRYWTPLYLFAALPPILLLGRIRFRSLVAVGAVLAALLSWSTLHAIFKTQTIALPDLRQKVRNGPALLDTLAQHIPADAIVYSVSWHGTLWSRYRTGLIGDIKPTAKSMARCARAGIPVYIYGSRFHNIRRRLNRALAAHRLKVVPVNPRLLIYSVQRR